MSIFNYLQLQPVEPSDDGTVSDLDEYTADDTIDLNADIDETELEQTWEKVLEDLDQDPEKLTFHEE
jgi:hypothetical protein